MFLLVILTFVVMFFFGLFVVATFRVARITLQTLVGWLVDVATDRDARDFRPARMSRTIKKNKKMERNATPSPKKKKEKIK